MRGLPSSSGEPPRQLPSSPDTYCCAVNAWSCCCLQPGRQPSTGGHDNGVGWSCSCCCCFRHHPSHPSSPEEEKTTQMLTMGKPQLLSSYPAVSAACIGGLELLCFLNRLCSPL